MSSITLIEQEQPTNEQDRLLAETYPNMTKGEAIMASKMLAGGRITSEQSIALGKADRATIRHFLDSVTGQNFGEGLALATEVRKDEKWADLDAEGAKSILFPQPVVVAETKTDPSGE